MEKSEAQKIFSLHTIDLFFTYHDERVILEIIEKLELNLIQATIGEN